MLSNGLVILFRILHIGFGVFWVGSIFFFARFLFPAAVALGPQAAPVLGYLTQVKKMPVVLLMGAMTTVLSGLVLFWHDSMGFHGEWMRSRSGMTFSLGGAAAILTVIVGATVNSPTAQKMGELGAAIQKQGGPPTPEQTAQMQALQAKMAVAIKVVATLLLIAVLAMATARYM